MDQGEEEVEETTTNGYRWVGGGGGVTKNVRDTTVRCTISRKKA